MTNSDNTKNLLEQLVAKLLDEQSKESSKSQGSHLIGGDGQFLGAISENNYLNESILNEYGPFGSQYSPTSIFNPYSQYGSEYGQFSINNPYCTNPPLLFINGKTIGAVSANTYLPNRIPVDSFIYTLKNDFKSVLAGRFIESDSKARALSKQSYIEAADGMLLGKLTKNAFDSESILNQYGTYGNKFSQMSIFNQFGNYGTQFSMLSPYNQMTKTPPKIFIKGKFHAYLTINRDMNPRISPDELLAWAQNNINIF